MYDKLSKYLADKGLTIDQAKLAVKADIESKLLSMVDGLKADIGTTADPAGNATINAILNQTNTIINASAATYIKSLARFMRSSHRAEIRAIRLLIRELSSDDALDV